MFESIFDILNVPLGFIIKISYSLTNNYAVALLLFAIVIKTLLLPFGVKQQKNMVKQAALKPKEMAIRNKYAGRTDAVTQKKIQEEVMALYQKENFNPMGGCLPMLLQMPILLSLYQVVTHPLKYLCGLSSEIITNITTRAGEISQAIADKGAAVSQIDVIELMRSNFASFSDIEGMSASVSSAADLPNFFLWGNSVDLSQTPSFTNPSWLLLIPLLTFVFMFGSMKINRKLMYQPEINSDNNMSLKIMDFTMPLFSVWISFTVPAIIGVYWIFQNIISVAQQFLLKKLFPYPTFTEEDYKRAEREYGGKPAKKKSGIATSGEKKKVRSLHHIDDDEYMAEYEAQQKAAAEAKESKKLPANGDGKLIAPAALKEDEKFDTDDAGDSEDSEDSENSENK